jgi:hypothetical protein
MMIDGALDAAGDAVALMGGGTGSAKDDANNPEQLQEDAEKTIQVSVVALPFKHFLRGLVPKWDKFTYFNDELSDIPDGSQTHAKHYYAYRHSLLVCGVFLQLVPVILEWMRWNGCGFNDGYIEDSKCDPIPDVFRSTEENQQTLLLDLYKMLKNLSLIEPVSSTIAWLLITVAAFKWRRVAFSKKLIIAAFVLKFVTPFTLQVIPFRSLIDFDGEFTGQTYNVDGDSDDFLDPCEAGVSNEDCWNLDKICKVGQKDKAFYASELDIDVDSTDASVVSSIKGYTDVANLVCQNVFRTRCDQTLQVSKSTTRLAVSCDKISEYVVDYWDAFAGGIFSALTLKLLAPAAMGLLPGIAKGATVVKFVLPTSSLVGYMMMMKPYLYTPMFIAFSISMFQAIGDVWFALAIVFLTLAQCGTAVFGVKLTNPMTLGATKKVAGRTGLCTIVCALLALVFFCLSFFLRTDYFDRLNELGLPAASYNIDTLQMLTLLVSVLANMFIAKLTFTDVVMSVVIAVHDKEKAMIADLVAKGVADARADVSALLEKDLKASSSVVVAAPESASSPNVPDTVA